MKRGYWNCLVPLLCIILISVTTGSAQAARGNPGSPEFGFGALVYPQGPDAQEAMAMAVDLELDWIRIPLDWKAYQDSPEGPIRLQALEPMMRQAEKNDIAVLVSVSNPPAWAVTRNGPDAEQAAKFVLAVVSSFPAAVRAVELFPGANTRQAWSANPDPQAYFDLYRKIDRQLRDQGFPILLVAAGLRPLPILHPAEDMDDIAYLRALYRLGASQHMPVISLQYIQLTGTPLLSPDAGEQRVLRHYETVRRTMIENDHQEGLIWITHLSLPSGKISNTDSGYREPEAQSVWLSQAYLQLRSQLYVGAAFLQSLNSNREGTVDQAASLAGSTGESHPFYPVLKEMIRLNKINFQAVMPGKAKEGSLKKKRP